jgi:hypothetical protein
MILVVGLICAFPAALVWRWKGLLAGLGAWLFCMFQLWMYFMWATAAPLNMIVIPELFVVFAIWWTWRCFYRGQPKPVQPIIPSQPGQSVLTSPVKSAWTNRISPWLALLVLAGVAAFLFSAQLNGAPSPYQSPQDIERSKRAMQMNDPSIAIQSQPQTSPSSSGGQSWSKTDDLSDWGKYVRP